MPCAAWGRNLSMPIKSALARPSPLSYTTPISWSFGPCEIRVYSQICTSAMSRKGAICCCLLSEFALELSLWEKNLYFARSKCRVGYLPGVVFTCKHRTRGCFSVRSALWRTAELRSGVTFQATSSTTNKLPMLSVKGVIPCDTSFPTRYQWYFLSWKKKKKKRICVSL